MRGIHARTDVNSMADLAMKLSNIPPTFLREFLSQGEEDTLFLNDLKEAFFFQSFVLFLGANKLRTTSNLRFLAIIAMAPEVSFENHPRHLRYLTNC